MENYGSSVHCEFIFLQVHAVDCYSFFPLCWKILSLFSYVSLMQNPRFQKKFE